MRRFRAKDLGLPVGVADVAALGEGLEAELAGEQARAENVLDRSGLVDVDGVALGVDVPRHVHVHGVHAAHADITQSPGHCTFALHPRAARRLGQATPPWPAELVTVRWR